jgi:hypothetical protein
VTELEASILKTVVYADIFDYPLTAKELWQYLIAVTTTYTAFQQALKYLLARDQLLQKQAWYVLPGRAKLISLRKKRTTIAVQKLKKAQTAARIIRFIPTVQGVALSGALAMQNAPADDDIDFFIITSPESLWLTRLCVIFILDGLGWRRKPLVMSFSDKICVNMFLDSNQLALPLKERDLYSAHEVIQLVPLVNKGKIFERFLQANAWVTEYLPHGCKLMKIPNTHISAGLWSWLEPMARRLQLVYMRKRRTTEQIGLYLLRFHPQDARVWIRNGYQKNIQSLGLRLNGELN